MNLIAQKIKKCTLITHGTRYFIFCSTKKYLLEINSAGARLINAVGENKNFARGDHDSFLRELQKLL